LKIAIAILSDIHFKNSSGHPIVPRADQIASAISMADTEIDNVLVVFSGGAGQSQVNQFPEWESLKNKSGKSDVFFEPEK
jgi:hypothetical protein